MTATTLAPAGPPIERPETRTLAKGGDRCDRCGAEAFVQATMKNSGNTLLFCGHHAARHWDALIASSAGLIDERHLINQTAGASA